MSNPDHPLTGIRVLDLTQIYNGPYATFLMAMAGADVIKVEPPGGEHLRRRNARGGALYPFKMLNPNKRSILLDLKNKEDRDIFLELASTADIIIENSAPGVVDRLGVGYETIKKIKPEIIYASGSGYGQDGPYKGYQAMDIAVQAMSGVMSATGFPDNPPVKAGVALCDFFAGIHRVSLDMVYPYSASKEVAEFIRNSDYSNWPLFGTRDVEVTSVSGYLGSSIYYPELKRTGTFTEWINRDSSLRREDSLIHILGYMKNNKNVDSLLVILSNSSDLGDDFHSEDLRLSEGLTISFIKQFLRSYNKPERYYLYEVRRI